MNYSKYIQDCWAYGASYLPLCGLPSWTMAFLPGSPGNETISLGGRRFRVLRKLGEGGYAVVLLVQELPSAAAPQPDPERRALKKVLVQSGEHLDAVQREIRIHIAVHHHPHILPLLDYSVCGRSGNVSGGGAGGAVGAPPGSLMQGAPATAAASTAATSTANNTAAAAAVPMPYPAGTSPSPAQPSAPAAGAATAHRSLEFGSGVWGGGLGAGWGAGGGGGGVGGGNDMACLLFPLYSDGTLADELEEMAARGERLRSREVLEVWLQMLKATAHMHSLGFAHRDIKPLNVLIAKNPQHPANTRSTPPTPPPQSRPQPPPRPVPGARGAAGEDVEAVALLTGGGSGIGAGGGGSESVGPRLRCVLMDLGSAGPRVVQLGSRSQALRLQEEAEAHCSAPYRAPELFDPPSPASLDTSAADVWALGCSLFHVMYGQPPFQRAMQEAGGSLALAVMNCAICWPRPHAPTYPSELHSLVTAAMAPELGDRPTAEQLLAQVEALMLRTDLPDPPLGAPPGYR